ncbi:MAG: MBL fold metallo-hydrolase [Phycisphaerales bacterium]|nr:MAG: MBL fold metallo-hydrolase [Phycisphaerales bacterium]
MNAVAQKILWATFIITTVVCLQAQAERSYVVAVADERLHFVSAPERGYVVKAAPNMGGPAVADSQPAGTNGAIDITILYDNYVLAEGVTADWGFACMIMGTEKNVLFDTGTNGSLLLTNMESLEVDPRDAELVVISHNHGDHTGGLPSFLGRNNDVTVYVPTPATSALARDIEARGAQVVSSQGPAEICRNVYTTGWLGTAIIEQSLVLDTAKGLVVITGCSHPGIVSILRRAKEIVDKDIYLVFGGFHLLNHSDAQVANIISEFRSLGVQKVGATHCTGERQIDLVRKAYGTDFVPIGVGELSLPCPVDLDGNGIVNFADVALYASSWRSTPLSPGWNSEIDIGPPLFGDGVIAAEDAAILLEHWLTLPGILAYWELDETEGGVAHDSVGGNDGYGPLDMVWWPEDGKLGGALEFDGTDDFLLTTFSLNPAETSFSAFAWIKGGGPGEVILSQASGANWLLADPSEGKLMTELRGSGRFGRTLLSQTVITDGNWHHVGMTWDGSNRILYVDDFEVARDTQTGLVGSDGVVQIGAGSAPAPGTYWDGLIDDVRIYNRAVTP